MKNKIIKLLAWICMVFSFLAISGCNSPKPLLKITTSTSVGVTIFSYTKYYIVYENGKVKKTDEFSRHHGETYAFSSDDYDETSAVLHSIDLNTPEGANLNRIANNILLLAKDPKLKIVAVGTLFVFGERYFFDVSWDENKRTSKLFEYNTSDNTIKEFASFSSGTIDHVELY